VPLALDRFSTSTIVRAVPSASIAPLTVIFIVDPPTPPFGTIVPLELGTKSSAPRSPTTYGVPADTDPPAARNPPNAEDIAPLFLI